MTDKVDITPTRNRIRDAVNRTNDPEALVRLAEMLGTKVEYLPDEIRPNFGPDQVRSMCQLRVGMLYLYVHVDSPQNSKIFLLVEGPYLSRRDDSKWWIDVRFGGKEGIEKLSLQDANVLPYTHSRGIPPSWGTSHIAFTDESRHLKQVDCSYGHTYSYHHG